ncbi:eight-cysteine-cluster domain-containing protein [Candidatus Woesearchaeota archaeon]|nr:eight-cysteine-cluster domain-containing protein [Candidatus Woesearchaeota archaeon]
MNLKHMIAALLLLAAIVTAACQTQPQPLQANDSAECLTDADCATAGCSGELCVKAEDADDTITTCEYKEEYACLKQTNCGCNEGKCGWKETTEYAKCIADISTTNK